MQLRVGGHTLCKFREDDALIVFVTNDFGGNNAVGFIKRVDPRISGDERKKTHPDEKICRCAPIDIASKLIRRSQQDVKG